MPRLHRHIWSVVLSTGLSGCLAMAPRVTAQSDEPAKLVELRERYQKELGSATKAPLEKYRETLLKLERSYVDKRDYTAAMQVRDERLRVEKRLASIQKRSGGDAPAQPYPGGPVTLAAKAATGGGGVNYSREKDALEGWKEKGSSARWSLPFPLKAGGYEVILEMACAPGSGGQVTVKEDFHTLSRPITPTKGWNDFVSQSIGTLRVSGNATGLSLGGLTIEGDGLFLLRGVKLVPVSEDKQP